MVRFVHSGDWQIGLTRRYLSADAQARFTGARIDAIRTIGQVAAERDAAFVVVAGDVFESNRLDRGIVCRALEALAESPVPVWLLPGNHDPLDAGSVYTSPTFTEQRPPHVHVLDGADPVEAVPGVDLVGAPWRSKHPTHDLVGAAIERLEPAPGRTRIVVGHGPVEALAPSADHPATIDLRRVDTAIDAGAVHYVALGDRHSLTAVGERARVHYAGAPEPTDHAEVAPGHVLVVDVDAERCIREAVRVGTWRFVRREHDVDGPEGVAAFEDWLASLPDKDRTICRVALRGSVRVRDKVRIDAALADAAHRFAAVVPWELRSDLAVLPDDGDLADLGLAGFAREAAEELGERAARDGDPAARDALALLYRLASGVGTR